MSSVTAINGTPASNGSMTSEAARKDMIERFQALFQAMAGGRVAGLEVVYHPDVVFVDPFTRVQGLDALTHYFEGAYQNVIRCDFAFGATIADDRGFCQPWTMSLRHRRLRKGELIQVDGISQLTVDAGLVRLHRDYFDAGQLLYENVPLLGSVVRWLRRQAV